MVINDKSNPLFTLAHDELQKEKKEQQHHHDEEDMQ